MPCYYFDPSLTAAWESIRSFLNSAFISAFLSALAGAGFGVLGAQRLAERSIRRKELTDSYRRANAIVVLAGTIANHALQLKKQHIAPLTKNYFEQRTESERINELILRGQTPQGPINFQAELVKITPITVPIDALKQLIYSSTTVPGRALALVTVAEQSVAELSHAIETRSEQIEIFSMSNMPQELLWQAYFGFKRRDGNTDAMYHDAMVAIESYTDDLAFFCAELAGELQKHAERLHKKLVVFARDTPKPSTIDFSGPIKSGLMPSREKYESWLSGFKTREPGAA